MIVLHGFPKFNSKLAVSIGNVASDGTEEILRVASDIKTGKEVGGTQPMLAVVEPSNGVRDRGLARTSGPREKAYLRSVFNWTTENVENVLGDGLAGSGEAAILLDVSSTTWVWHIIETAIDQASCNPDLVSVSGRM